MYPQLEITSWKLFQIMFARLSFGVGHISEMKEWKYLFSYELLSLFVDIDSFFSFDFVLVVDRLLVIVFSFSLCVR